MKTTLQRLRTFLISQEKIFLFIRLLLQFSNFRKSEMLHFFFKDARSRKFTTATFPVKQRCGITRVKYLSNID